MQKMVLNFFSENLFQLKQFFVFIEILHCNFYALNSYPASVGQTPSPDPSTSATSQSLELNFLIINFP